MPLLMVLLSGRVRYAVVATTILSALTATVKAAAATACASMGVRRAQLRCVDSASRSLAMTTGAAIAGHKALASL